MKGVVLAGGLGTRLLPMTRVTNKHLLPVYDRPMIYYPLERLAEAGVGNVLVITGGDHAADVRALLGDGSEFGFASLDFAHQEGHGGIAAALALAQPFAAGAPLVVILGDNLYEAPISDAVADYRADPSGSMILLKEVSDPQRFGVATIEDGRVTGIVEKPTRPVSPYAVTGCYMYDGRVFDVIRSLEPSGRGELEITDVNNRYIEWGEMRHRLVEGWWSDAGTVPSLHRAATLVARAIVGPEGDSGS